MGRISPLPRRVKMSRGNTTSYGYVIDEASVEERHPVDRDYIDLIQHIEWDDGGFSIRFCYYVKEYDAGEDAWTFSNRTISIRTNYLKRISINLWFCHFNPPRLDL